MKYKLFLSVALAGLFFSLPSTYALEPHKGFEEIPWGSNAEFINANSRLELTKENGLNPDGYNLSTEAKYHGFYMGPAPRRLVFTGEYSEKIEYFLVKDKLAFVIYTPKSRDLFRPWLVIKSFSDRYEAAGALKKKKESELPRSVGVVSPQTEEGWTYDWENSEGMVRMAIKAWPIEDLRQVFKVYIYSKTMSTANVDLLVRHKEEVAAALAKQQADKLSAAIAKREAKKKAKTQQWTKQTQARS